MSFFNKVAGHTCFPVNIAKFLKTHFFMERLWLVLLKGFLMADVFNNETIIWSFHKSSDSFLSLLEYGVSGCVVITKEFNFKEQIHKVTAVRIVFGQ